MKPGTITALILAMAGLASAHAFVDHAEPKVGSDNSASPAIVKIWFTQAIEPAYSSVSVYDANGKQVDKKDAHVDGNDKKLLTVSLPQLSAGAYKVTWRVLSVDTHRTQGDFKFTVK